MCSREPRWRIIRSLRVTKATDAPSVGHRGGDWKQPLRHPRNPPQHCTPGRSLGRPPSCLWSASCDWRPKLMNCGRRGTSPLYWHIQFSNQGFRPSFFLRRVDEAESSRRLSRSGTTPKLCSRGVVRLELFIDRRLRLSIVVGMGLRPVRLALGLPLRDDRGN